jgi:hypothetical protein
LPPKGGGRKNRRKCPRRGRGESTGESGDDFRPDPQIAAASRLAAWLGLRLRPDDFANVRLVLWSLILNSGGLVLAVAFGLPRRSIRE